MAAVIPLLVLLGALVAAACGSSLRQIPRGQHPLSGGAEPLAVDSEPPPARIDEVSPAPANDCAWADGSWRWISNGWNWSPGAWVRPPDGCYYADSLIVWVPSLQGSGVLFYTHGQWYREGSAERCVDPTPC